MNQSFGQSIPSRHVHPTHRPASRYLVLIASGGPVVARLLLADRTQVAEFDASTEEVTQMTKGLVATLGASGTEWDRALAGHSADERAAAAVYTLDL